MKVLKPIPNNDIQLNNMYQQFQTFTINEHWCDEDIAELCTRWLKEYMVRQLDNYMN